MSRGKHKQSEWIAPTGQPIRRPSHLYHVAPISVGTPLVEGLTSYIARLAAAHHVYPSELLVEELVPRITDRNYLHWTAQHTVAYPTGLAADTIWLNGASQLTHELVPILEALTLRDDLRYTTMLTWEGSISTLRLLRPYRAWCGQCLAAWRREGQTLYEPLIWQLAPSKLCEQHNVALDSVCPACLKTSIPLTARMQVGYCAHCLGWLGQVESQRMGAAPTNEAEFATQTWVVFCLGELLAAMPDLVSPPGKEGLRRSIGGYAARLTGGNRWLLGRRLGVTRTSFAAWYEGSHLPSLTSLLDLSQRLNTTPLKLLTNGETVAADVQLQLNLADNTVVGSKQPRKGGFDIQAVGEVLKAELANTNGQQGIKAVARKYGYNVPTLYRHLPDLCRTLATKHSEYVAAQRGDREARLRADVRAAVLLMHEQGLKPYQTKVAELVSPNAGVRWLVEFKDAYRAAIAEIEAKLKMEA